MTIKTFVAAAALTLIVASCSAPKDIAYMQGIDEVPAEVLKATAQQHESALMPGDMVQINVSASDPDVVKPFNKSTYIAAGQNMNQNNNDNSIYYYLIDQAGYIDFPLLGRVKLAGLTETAAQQAIASLIYPKYITERPVVEIRLQNFHVYTMGEVSSPGEIKATSGKINILEAIAKSGDLTIQGRRDNVMVIHTNADGSRSVSRVNLTDKNLLASPSFNLKQNDVVYVEPNESKQRSSFTVPPQWTLGVSALGALISVVTLIVTLTK